MVLSFCRWQRFTPRFCKESSRNIWLYIPFSDLYYSCFYASYTSIDIIVMLCSLLVSYLAFGMQHWKAGNGQGKRLVLAACTLCTRRKEARACTFRIHVHVHVAYRMHARTYGRGARLMGARTGWRGQPQRNLKVRLIWNGWSHARTQRRHCSPLHVRLARLFYACYMELETAQCSR